MIELLNQKPLFLFYIILCYLSIAYSGNGAIFILPAITLLFRGKDGFLMPFLALLLLLPLADSTFNFAMNAYNTRPVILLLLGILLIIDNSVLNKIDWSFKNFLPYFIIVGYYAFKLPSFSETFKSISYLLVILITPVVTKHIIKVNKDDFLRVLILLYTLVYIYSFTSFGDNTALQSYGRFSGIFNNPNALGIFSFLFFMLSTIIFKFQRHLFTKIERYFVIGIIIAGVLYSRSRSGMFAIALFGTSLWVYDRWKLNGIITLAIISIAINYTIPFESIIRSIGLADFFRLESIETGSGRKLAFMHAWVKIKEQPWSGYGIGFTEQYFTESQVELAKAGHVGSIHNSFLWIWLDLGIWGLLSFVYGWYSWFKKTLAYSPVILSVGLAVLFSANIESWLVGSLNHVTIQLLITLSLLSSPKFIHNNKVFQNHE